MCFLSITSNLNRAFSVFLSFGMPIKAYCCLQYIYQRNFTKHLRSRAVSRSGTRVRKYVGMFLYWVMDRACWEKCHVGWNWQHFSLYRWTWIRNLKFYYFLWSFTKNASSVFVFQSKHKIRGTAAIHKEQIASFYQFLHEFQ